MPSNFTETGTQYPSKWCMPYRTISDTWDILKHGIDESVAELPSSPEKQQLPPPSNSPPCGTAARAEDMESADGLGNSAALEWSRKAPTASQEVQPAFGATQNSPTVSQFVDSLSTDPTFQSPPSDALPPLTASQTTPTTPLDPPSDGEGVGIPELSLSTSPLIHQREGAQGPGANTRSGTLSQTSEARGKKRAHEPEDSDVENEACVKQARREELGD